jgi:hypothetical protein
MWIIGMPKWRVCQPSYIDGGASKPRAGSQQRVVSPMKISKPTKVSQMMKKSPTKVHEAFKCFKWRVVRPKWRFWKAQWKMSKTNREVLEVWRIQNPMKSCKTTKVLNSQQRNK